MPEQLQTQSVTAALLALGSNYQAEHYLSRVREGLAALGEIQLSTAFENPDFTSTEAQPKPDYTNQCVYLLLTVPISLQQLQQIFKDLAGDRRCHGVGIGHGVAGQKLAPRCLVCGRCRHNR